VSLNKTRVTCCTVAGDLAGGADILRTRTGNPRKGASAPTLQLWQGPFSNLGGLLLAQNDPCGARSRLLRARAGDPRNRRSVPTIRIRTTSSTISAGLLVRRAILLERGLILRARAGDPRKGVAARPPGLRQGASTILGRPYCLCARAGPCLARGPYTRGGAGESVKRRSAPDHRVRLGVLNNLGYLLRAQGDLAGARAFISSGAA
jgi:hypothetical protein